MARIAKSIIAQAQQLLNAKADGSLGNVAAAELLSFYNANAERFELKPVKKFADRKTAEKRVAELAQKIDEAANAAPAAKEPKDLSAAVAKSWQDPEVAAARSARHAVKVGKETYKSTRAAFDALGLNLAKHVAFRGQLVKAGKAEFEGHKFEVVAAA